MAEARMIEMMARAVLARRGVGFYTDPMEGGQDAYDISCEAIEEMRAALSVLAANVSDEMVEAAENGMSEKQFLTLPREEMRRAIAAAISAAGDEDRRA